MEDEESLSEIKSYIEIISDTIGMFMIGGLIMGVVVIGDTLFLDGSANQERALIAIFAIAFLFAGTTYIAKGIEYNNNKKGKDK